MQKQLMTCTQDPTTYGLPQQPGAAKQQLLACGWFCTSAQHPCNCTKCLLAYDSITSSRRMQVPSSVACLYRCARQVERLASGLRHERAFVAAALDVSQQKAAAFASNMLGVSQVPAVLLYPEAARGCLKFLGRCLV
jgi:hypothetical protein